MPHPIKGQGLYAFVTLIQGTEETDALAREQMRDSLPGQRELAT